MTVKIRHWNFNDGWRNNPEFLVKQGMPIREYDPDLVGWHCWAYADATDGFPEWMEENMRDEYECDFRFNSGDPMFTVQIMNEEDAALFKLRWGA